MDSGVGLAQLCTFLGLIGLSVLCTKFPSRSLLRRRIKIHVVKMDKDMMHEAINHAIEEFEQYTDQTDIASHLRNFFQNKYGGIWHCVVGNNFGISLRSKAGHVIHFNVDAQGVLLYRYDGDP